jgi:DNA polymerase-4
MEWRDGDAMPAAVDGDRIDGTGSPRKIIHIDMDAFFASVEQREFPHLRGKPIIVGGSPSQRGVVCTCSYEARSFGICSGMATSQALKLCPNAILMPVRMDLYCRISEEIFKIFSEFTPVVEPLSIDEGYLDVTANFKNNPSAVSIAQEIQRKILQKTGLSSSAGVSYNLFLAKVASAMRKPGGLTVIHPRRAIAFLESLPIEKFYGIGRVTARRLERLNIHRGRDLKMLSRERLMELLGKRGHYYYDVVRGIDSREVTPVRKRKSFGREITFPRDTNDLQFLEREVSNISNCVALMLSEEKLWGKTLTLKVKFADFRQITRSYSFYYPINSGQSIEEITMHLLRRCVAEDRRKIRLVGVAISRLFSDASGMANGVAVQQEFSFAREVTQLCYG